MAEDCWGPNLQMPLWGLQEVHIKARRGWLDQVVSCYLNSDDT